MYDGGAEPDARFTFANERTFLAWIRTSLAFLAAGVALDTVTLPWPAGVQRALAALMVLLGLVAASASWLRWALAERALRRDEPLPGSGVSMVLTIALLVAGVVLLVAEW